MSEAPLEPESSERIYEGAMVNLRVSRYRRPSGTVVQREVVDHPGGVVMVPLDDDQVLMVRQPREAVGRFLLELPAGKLDVPGESPLETAKRELAEEVGRAADRWVDLGGFFTAPGLLSEYMHGFLATGLRPVEAEAPEDEEIEVVAWPLRDLPRLLERVEDAKSLVGLLRLARILGL